MFNLSALLRTDDVPRRISCAIPVKLKPDSAKLRSCRSSSADQGTFLLIFSPSEFPREVKGLAAGLSKSPTQHQTRIPKNLYYQHAKSAARHFLQCI